MARIRNVKPEFFRHELLQELESQHPEAKPMLIYIGLWTQSGKNGVFLWKPKQLKLDLLPYVDFNIEASLSMLEKYGFIVQFEQNGKKYGYVPKFILHQAISTREKQAKAPFPDYTGTLPEQGEDSYGIVPTQCQHSVVSDPGTSLHHDIGLHDIGRNDEKALASPSPSVSRDKFQKPTLEELQSFITENQLSVNADTFIDYYESNGWLVGKVKMKNWQATVKNWHRRGEGRTNANEPKPAPKRKEYRYVFIADEKCPFCGKTLYKGDECCRFCLADQNVGLPDSLYERVEVAS